MRVTNDGKTAILYPSLDETDFNATSSINADIASWESHTRHLSYEEFVNPYWMFEKFVKIRNWEEALQEIMEFALSYSSIESSFKIRDVMRWRERMLAVVEGDG